MIKQVILNNYKSYASSVVNFKPITLLCGGNSSGKTSIIKSILLLKQSFEATGNNYLLINGPYTQNGQFQNVRHNYRTDATDTGMTISISFVVDTSNSSFKDICRSIGMTNRLDDIKGFEICANFSFSEDSTIPQVGEISSTEIILTTNYSEIASRFHGQSISSSIQMQKCEDGHHYAIFLSNFPTPLYKVYPFEYLDHRLEQSFCYFRGMQLVSLFQPSLSKKATSALPVLYTVFRVLSNEFERVEYIGPLRETPLRHYYIQDVYTDIGVKGEHTAHFLGQYGTSKIKTPLPNASELQETTLNDAVSQWAMAMGIEKVSVITADIPGAKISQIMVGEQNIVDVGFGVSQVLPILVEGLTIGAGNTLILEQPEIHLHPKMQMEIADFLVMMAKQGKHMIVETHSDHIINRIVRRSLEDSELRDMVNIFYCEKDDEGISRLSDVVIDTDLGIGEAPDGFFDQYAAETEEILNAGYRNMCKRRENRNGDTSY